MKNILHKYGTRPNEIRRAKRELYGRLSLVALAMVFFAIILVVTRFQPGLEEGAQFANELDQGSGNNASTAQVELRRQEVELRFKQFQALIEQPDSALENIEVIETAIDLQRQVIRMRTSDIAPKKDVEKLEELQTSRDSVMGDYLIAQSNREEELAMLAWSNGDSEDAINRMNRAILVQDKINEQYPRSAYRSATRLHRLTKQRLLWQTQPIAEAADRLKDMAFQLAAEEAFAKARKTIRLALQKQEILMQDYRNSSYSTLTRMRTFREALREIDSAENSHRATALLQASRDLLERGDHESALAKAGEALELQQALVETNGMADKENLDRLESIRSVHETAASMPTYQMIASAKADTRRALLDRDMQRFQSRLADWYRESRLFVRRFPNSSHLDKIDTDEVELLYSLRTEIPVILDTVLANLVELPGAPSLYMLRTEVSQALYESVAGMNPSSSKDPAQPVESVTWQEAQLFVERLGVVLALPVFLPTASQVQQALGEPSLATMREHAWSAENSNRAVQPCGRLAGNDGGFFDLLGNVAEWVSADLPPEPGRVLAMGGSVRDSAARLAGIPRDWRSPEERNRFIGFRFVVDRRMDLE